MKASHVYLVVFLASPIAALISVVLTRVGIELGPLAIFMLSAPIGLAAIVLAWPLARRLGMSPLMVLAGPCPGCKQRPPGWWASRSGETERLQLVCGHCGSDLELWLTRQPPLERVAKDRPAFRLRWPEFLGIWKRIAPPAELQNGTECLVHRLANRESFGNPRI